jgi:photosystem II stability/assembly factor-like uncharacterized protein
MMSSAYADHVARLRKLIQNRNVIEVVEAPQYQLIELNPQLDFDITTTEKVKAGQQTQKPLATLEQVRLLTTQQAWETAKARGYSKSRDAFRAWSRRSPEKCRELYGLIVITDPQQGKLIGYQDDQADGTLETDPQQGKLIGYQDDQADGTLEK